MLKIKMAWICKEMSNLQGLKEMNNKLEVIKDIKEILEI